MLLLNVVSLQARIHSCLIHKKFSSLFWGLKIMPEPSSASPFDLWWANMSLLRAQAKMLVIKLLHGGEWSGGLGRKWFRYTFNFPGCAKTYAHKEGEKSHSLSHLFHVQLLFERNFSSRFHWLNFYKRKYFTSRLRLYSRWRKKGEAFNEKHSRRGDVESAYLCVHENKHLSTEIYSTGYAGILCQHDAHTLLFMFCFDFTMTQHLECGYKAA